MFIASSAFKDFVMSGVRVCLLGAILAVYVCCSALLVKAQTTDPSEVAALEAIKSSLIDPLKNLKSWNKGDPCMSNWTGILCYNTTLDDGYLHVKELQMLTMNLSGTLAADLGRLSYLQILDFMWNEISGSIPKEIGNIKSLILLLLNGNQLSGSLPDELGYLPNLDRIQIDQNHILGPIPKSFANMEKLKHLHMNNNSISGEIPPELSKLPILVHFLLDNNNLSGRLPPELSQLPNLRILQLDNNNFHGSEIPASYSNMSKLLKLSLRNCSLQGAIPDLSSITNLLYLDLSWNHLTGSIPSNKLSDNITTIELAYNNLNGSIPTIFSDLPLLQKLSLENNSLSGFVPSIWQNMTFSGKRRLFLYFQNNLLSNISDVLNPPANVTIIILNVNFNLCSVPTSSVGTVGGLQGNPICVNANQFNIVKFCGSQNGSGPASGGSTNLTNGCPIQACPTDDFYEYVPAFSPGPCFCAAPLIVGYRLKSPGVSDFPPYELQFEGFLSSHLSLHPYQLVIYSFAWEAGPRLRMYLKLFPVYDDRPSFSRHTFNESEILRIKDMFTDWSIPNSPLFGPAELLDFTLLGPYSKGNAESSKSGISKGVLAGIVLGAVAGTLTISAIISILIMRRLTRHYRLGSKRCLSSKISIKIDGVKDFTFGEMALATSNFSLSTQVGQGGYGKVYRGILADGTVVAIKRAQEGSLQGTKEFLTEIELLSRLHHRNLVSLLGYCNEEDEQMLVYEFMPNGTLRDHLSGKAKLPLSFTMRLRIAICSAKAILYLHMEADPPIFHRDIKATNILLDSNFTAKVADFGLSRLASLPEIDGSVPGYVSTIVKGTPGYLDPEYVLTHKLTDKSDVYSLGVVFLELLTGMQAISHGKNIVREVNLAYQSGLMFSVIDSRMGSYPSECVEQFVSLALRCCHDETDERPSMAEVVRELEIIWRRMPETDITPSEFTATDAGSRPLPSSSYSTTDPFTPSEISGREFTATDAGSRPLPSSSYSTTDPFTPSEISGSDLRSSVAPIIRPR